MLRYAAISATVLLLAPILVGSVAAQQISADQRDQAAKPVGIQAEVMPPTPEATMAPTIDEADASPALLNDQSTNSYPADEPSAAGDSDNIEMKLVTRGIYQCQDGNRTVFVDEENRKKYHQCTQIRAPYYEQVSIERSAESERASCSGAIVYKGSTYVFNDHEPCPIPEEIFEARKPIEANPEYYTQPTP